MVPATQHRRSRRLVKESGAAVAVVRGTAVGSAPEAIDTVNLERSSFRRIRLVHGGTWHPRFLIYRRGAVATFH